MAILTTFGRLEITLKIQSCYSQKNLCYYVFGFFFRNPFWEWHRLCKILTRNSFVCISEISSTSDASKLICIKFSYLTTKKAQLKKINKQWIHSKYSLNLECNNNYLFFYMKYSICQAAIMKHDNLKWPIIVATF